MKKIPLFENFIPLGFATNMSSLNSLGGHSNIKTGYNMDAIVGPVLELSKCVAEQANLYESDEDPSHTANEYIKEAKDYINKIINESCDSYKK